MITYSLNHTADEVKYQGEIELIVAYNNVFFKGKFSTWINNIEKGLTNFQTLLHCVCVCVYNTLNLEERYNQKKALRTSIEEETTALLAQFKTPPTPKESVKMSRLIEELAIEKPFALNFKRMGFPTERERCTFTQQDPIS